MNSKIDLVFLEGEIRQNKEEICQNKEEICQNKEEICHIAKTRLSRARIHGDTAPSSNILNSRHYGVVAPRGVIKWLKIEWLSTSRNFG